MRIQSFSDINFADHHLVDVVWQVASSRPGEMYDVRMTDLGFSCNCIAGSMRGKCKHAQHVHDLLVMEDPLPVDLF
jgi:hypothetical protein